MRSEILLALLPYLLLVLGLGLNAGLFVLLKLETGRHGRRLAEERRLREELQAEMRALVEELRETVAQNAGGWQPVPAPPRVSIDMSRRAQILRLARRGERPEQISAAVGIPQNEVCLLLKLHQTAQTPVEGVS